MAFIGADACRLVLRGAVGNTRASIHMDFCCIICGAVSGDPILRCGKISKGWSLLLG